MTTEHPVQEDDSDRMTPQSCPKGIHADWAADSEHTHTCPWCEIERLGNENTAFKRLYNRTTDREVRDRANHEAAAAAAVRRALKNPAAMRLLTREQMASHPITEK